MARAGCSRSCQAMVGTPPADGDLLALDQLAAPARRPSGASARSWRPRSAPGPARRSSRWRGRTAPTSSADLLRRRAGSGSGGGSPRRRKCARAGDAPAHDVGDDVAVGAQRALRLPGGARGVEDGGVVVRVERRRPAAAGRAARPSRSAAPMHVLQPVTRRGSAISAGGAADIDRLQVRAARQQCSAMRSSRSASTISDLGPGIRQAVLQLRARSTRRSAA